MNKKGRRAFFAYANNAARLFLSRCKWATPTGGSRRTVEQVQEHLERGVNLKNEGRYEEAQSELKTALDINYDNAEVHRQLGLVYSFIGLFDEAIEELIVAVRLDETDLGVRNDLALTYSMLGMCDEAKAEFEAVLLVDPNNETAKKNIVYFVQS